jgi:hypothetical protein
MIKIKLTGHERAIAAVSWLTKNGWSHNMTLEQHDPFSGGYIFEIEDLSQAFMFKLKWGGANA